MATKTFGSTGQTSMTAVPFAASLAAADVATIQIAIKDDLSVAHPTWPGAFALNGLLHVPNRGVLRVLPGDYVGVDDKGWPILVSAYSIANGLWIHS